jgi:hypothetical protein
MLDYTLTLTGEDLEECIGHGDDKYFVHFGGLGRRGHTAEIGQPVPYIIFDLTFSFPYSPLLINARKVS